jgi:Zn-dependent protease
MLNEPASSIDDEKQRVDRRLEHSLMQFPDQPQRDAEYTHIRAAVSDVLTIYDEKFILDDEADVRRDEHIVLLHDEGRLLLTFKGRLRISSETAYERLDEFFARYDLLPIFRTNATTPNAPHTIHVVQGRVKPVEGGGWLALFLFIATVFSVLFVGTLSAVSSATAAEAQAIIDNLPLELWRGIPYAASILLILGAHELGHYFLARRNNTAASLPYFLPFPFGIFGTFGAAIRLREPMRNRKVLLEIGAAGPLAGLFFAIPILWVGLATSEVGFIQGGLIEGNSILYGASKFLILGEWLPADGRDVFVNQLAWAGWTGLLVTGLNLIPVGQLDGGHILYSLLGDRARQLYWPIIAALVALTVLVANELFIFVLLILLMGNNHATPLDDITELDDKRRYIAVMSLIVFALVFVPSPITQAEAREGIFQTPSGSAALVPTFAAFGLVLVQRMWACLSR